MVDGKNGKGKKPPPDDRFTEDLGIAPDYQPGTFEYLRKSRAKFVKTFRSILDGKDSNSLTRGEKDQDQE